MARIVGGVSNVAWSSELRGHRAVFNARNNPATNFQGSYTVLPPGAYAAPGAGFSPCTILRAALYLNSSA